MNPLILMLTFTGFGLLCFGGGYPLVPLLEIYFVHGHGIITLKQFGNLVSIAQLTPGPVGINCATYVGYISGGFWSSLLATLGLIIPSLTLGYLAACYLARYRDSFWVQGILTGLRPAAVAMIIYAATIFLGISVFTAPIPWRELLRGILPADFGISLPGVVVFAVSLILLLKTKLPIMALILLGGALGGVWAWLGC